MKRSSLTASIIVALALASSGALAAPPPGNAAPALIDFESCALGTNCFPLPLDHVGAGASGQVVDLNGNKAFQLDIHPYGGNPEITQAELYWYGETHLLFDVPFNSGAFPRTEERLFDFSPADVTFDVFMPDGGYVFDDWGGKTLVGAGEWTTIFIGDRTPYGGVALIRGGVAYIDNVSYGRLQSAAPEPTAWALMLLGFGAAGVILRRASRAIVEVA